MNLTSFLRSAVMLTAFWVLPVLIHARGTKQVEAYSSLQQLAQTRDTARIDLLLKISDELIHAEPSEALAYSREALAMAGELNDSYRTGMACRSVARVYSVTAVYDKSLEYLLLALNHFKERGDTLEIASCYDEIGVVQREAGDFSEAQVNHQAALELNKKIANPAGIARNYMNLGSNYLKTDSIDKALSYFLVSLIITDSLQMEPEKVMLLKNIGSAYARLGKYEEALGHFYTMLEMLGEKPDDLNLAEAQVNIAMGYYHMKRYPVAMKYARDAYDLSRSRKFHRVYQDAARVLADIYAAQGDYRKAYEYVKEYRNISDTIMNAEKSQQLAHIQTLYDVNVKDAENQVLRKENLLNAKRMRTRFLVIVLFTILVIVLASVLYILNRMNNRYIELNKKLAAQSGELETLNDVKDKFFSFVAHNLKNPFNTIMGFAELMQRAAEARDISKVRQYSGLIYNLSSQVQKVLSNLLEWSRLQRRSFEVKSETVELRSLIKDVVEMNNKEAARKDIALSISNGSDVFVAADRAMITTVLQNLVNNAITFTPPGGQIALECLVNEQFTEVSITDTGIGIPEETLSRLFDFDFSQSKIGVAEQGGAGLGLVICHEMLLKNGGTIAAHSEPGKGSRFTFTLPVAQRHDTVAETDPEHKEIPAMDAADELVSSNIPIGPEAMKDMQGIITRQYEEVSRVLSIENLEKFARTLIDSGEKHNLVSLSGYGKSLLMLTRGHQIDQIIRLLPRFREYLDAVQKS